MRGLPFDFEVPVTVFEKSGAEPGKGRRIGGLVSTESKDRQRETLLQRGLDFEPFAVSGWYNDNHDKKTGGIVGYPDLVQKFKKGQKLPDGKTAKTDGTWAEGYLLDTPRADEIWELGKALQKTGRSLGFSVEGSIHRRAGHDQKTVTKATVRNVAITGCPVNPDSKMEILAKSIEAVESSEDDAIEKALGMGEPSSSAPAGPKTGEGAGAVVAKEDLERDEDEDEKEKAKKSLTDSEAISWVQSRCPGIGLRSAARIVEATKTLKRQGRL